MVPKKPNNLSYGLNDKPPFLLALLLGFQHICLVAVALMLPVLIIREISGTDREAEHLVAISMIAGGIGTIMQSLKNGPLGSGFLCPQVCGPSFLWASILAAKTGGLALMYGMTLLAGIGEAFLSRLIPKLRTLFPAEVTGLIVAMVGITVTKLAVMNFLGLARGEAALCPSTLTVACLTLLVMVGLNVWGKGKAKLFCILIGMIFGYILAFILQVAPRETWNEVIRAPWLTFPFTHHPGWKFSPALIIPFLVAMLCSTLKSVGDLTTCQKINDAEWRRPDMRNISGGILADAASAITAGILGGVGQSTSSSNIGLSVATGITSRFVGLIMGSLLIALAFFPKVAAIFAITPEPVIGAVLIFAMAFMVIAGMQIIMSRMMDNRKIFVVGLSLIFGLGVDICPNAFASLPVWIKPVFSSSLSLTAVMAIVLNLIFRIGIARKASIQLIVGTDTSEKVFAFMERQGAAWGARREVIHKAAAAINEFLEAARCLDVADNQLSAHADFDECSLNVVITHRGRPMPFPDKRPDEQAVRADPAAQTALSGFIIAKYADKITTGVDGAFQKTQIYFEH